MPSPVSRMVNGLTVPSMLSSCPMQTIQPWGTVLKAWGDVGVHIGHAGWMAAAQSSAAY